MKNFNILTAFTSHHFDSQFKAFNSLFLPSLNYYLDPAFSNGVCAISPSSKVKEIRDSYGKYEYLRGNFSSKFFNYSRFFNNPSFQESFVNFKNVYKSVFLLAEAPKHYNTDYFLYVPPTAFLVKNMRSTDIFENGKARYNTHSGIKKDSLEAIYHFFGWNYDKKAPAKVRYPGDRCPQFISRNILIEMTEHFEKLASKNGFKNYFDYFSAWQEKSGQKLSFFQLYWTFLEKNGRTAEFYGRNYKDFSYDFDAAKTESAGFFSRLVGKSPGTGRPANTSLFGFWGGYKFNPSNQNFQNIAESYSL